MPVILRSLFVHHYIYIYIKSIAHRPVRQKYRILSGYNEVDLEYAEEKGLAVCSILDYCTEETAENAMALMLNLQRGIRRYDKSVQEDHVWDYLVARDMHLKRIAGQTMGIAGLGRIGQSAARLSTCWSLKTRI